MSDDEQTGEVEVNPEEQRLEGSIDKKMAKLVYFLEETVQIITEKNYGEMEAVNDRAAKILDKISELILQAEELKIDKGKTSRSVRQWKKGKKSKYAAFIEHKERLVQQLKKNQENLEREIEVQRLEAEERQLYQQEQRRAELREAQEERERAANDPMARNDGHH